MMAKVMLISYPGYPATIREFYPDNGLAVLAASLISKGHVPIILDFANPGLISWFFPYDYAMEINSVVSEVREARKSGGRVPEATAVKMRSIDERINAFQKDRMQQFVSAEIIKRIEEFRPDIIGMKLWIGEGFTGSIRIAEIIKARYPKMKIYAGGPQVDWFGENIYKFGFGGAFDALSCGDGEETITGLADHADGAADIGDIPNLILPGNGGYVFTQRTRVKDLDASGRPVYDEGVYYPSDLRSKIRIMMIDESRGCPNRCSFCVHPHKSGNYWITRSAESVVDEIEHVMARYGTNVFRFAGSNPPPHLKKAIAKEIIRRRIKVKYAAFGHARGLEKEDYELLKESGCLALFFGVESGSQLILDNVMNKKNKVEQIREALKMSVNAGIKTAASVIVPAPSDTAETMEETFRLLADVRPYSVIVNLPGALPHTGWYDNMERYGFGMADKEAYMKKGMTYTIKNFYPQEMWMDFPDYSLDGKPFLQLARISSEFSRRLEKEGISTRVTDDLALLINALGAETKDIMDRSWQALSSGRREELEDMVFDINGRIKGGMAS
jgi:anaerobic magnesium-protoporphyrin IX monomethyl ester cyclase